MKKFHFLLALFFYLIGQYVSAQTLVWSTLVDTGTCFSSPRAGDLNNDGILDFVTGGGEEGFYRTKSITAYNGATGDILWHVAARNRIYGSAVFLDISGDGNNDVFIGGGSAEFMAINGISGEIIWEFFPEGDTVPAEDFGWYNFYSPQLIPDQDGDDLQDLLVSNGGNPAALPIDTINRPPGNLLILSSATGDILGLAEVPDGKETYMSPLVYDFGNDGILDVIYGTGGETTHGSLWRTTVPDILAGDINASVKLIDGGPKGYIAPPSLADLTGDGTPDIIAPCYGNKLTAIDGNNGDMLWQKNLPGTETICTPAIGRFTDDHIPDVFFIYATGLAPTFFNYVTLMIDGATGQTLVQDTLPGWSLISPLAFDYNGDGFDEALVSTNQPFMPPGPYAHQILLYDFANDQTSTLIDITPGTNLGSTPWVGDIDDNGTLELVYLHNNNPMVINVNDGFVLKRYDLTAETPGNIAWGAYMGTEYDCLYDNPMQSCFNYVVNFSAVNVTCFGGNNGIITGAVQVGTPPYRYIWNGVTSGPNFSPTYAISIQNLEAGNYTLQMLDGVGCLASYEVTLTQPDELVAEFSSSTPTAGNSDGEIEVLVSGGTPPYTYEWNTTPPQTGTTATNLAAGVYSLTVTDSTNCTLEQTVDLFVTGMPLAAGSEYNCLLVYPNPANKMLSIQTNPNLINEDGLTLYLFNNIGQLMHSQSLLSGTTLQLDVSAYPAGVYRIQVTGKNTSLQEQVILYR
ncbi:MAG: PQQ-binding-like beta-propeller repeat protein [Sphingobacteriales bacterium]|nr:MAG: PQQ-binding-like beta-propeller repeat protein [Sphingobacteriales bacterium]